MKRNMSFVAKHWGREVAVSSYADIAVRAGVTRQYVCMVLLGKTMPAPKSALKLAAALGMSLQEFTRRCVEVCRERKHLGPKLPAQEYRDPPVYMFR